ncbi:MAG: biotin--[acetyl-CoA-carboxylase] ligase [Magnetococcales bacterium]|nr:biotin--[acetyl-CoA-carboxylase] ligase [Magnetococcales bacterium]MBF0116513.1 biotin--[acetyl-CoA-carboxylase] ligase [Magnetococcales bacterium]
MSPSEASDLRPEHLAPLLRGGLFRAERYHYYALLESTNRQAAQWAQQGAAEGTVVVAEQQSQGRGRLGRHWSSPAGINLYCSLLLRPRMAARHAAQLTLVAGLALWKTVQAWGIPDCVLKWPNDLLLRGRKAAGILTEMRAEGERPIHVIVGIGVNLNGGPGDLPDFLQGQAIHLAEVLLSPVDRGQFLAALLAQWEDDYTRQQTEGFAALAQEWMVAAALPGRRVHIALAEGSFAGEAVTLDADGCLLVKRADGMLTRVVAGDVTLLGQE